MNSVLYIQAFHDKVLRFIGGERNIFFSRGGGLDPVAADPLDSCVLSFGPRFIKWYVFKIVHPKPELRYSSHALHVDEYVTIYTTIPCAHGLFIGPKINYYILVQL